MARFTAVIFDFGGVITDSPFEAFNRLEAERGLPRDTIRRINAANGDDNAWARVERAEIDRDAFDRAFAAEAAALGHALGGAEVLACLGGTVRPAMVAALDTLRGAGFKLGCITNNFAPAASDGERAPARDGRADLMGSVFARFDHVIESAKAGLRKPDPRIYSMMCDALAVAPGACVYLDDLGINCKPAGALGMAAIKVTSEAQALAELSALTGLALGPPQAVDAAT